jgi:TRAP transporter TAXI family solute receptor
MSRLQERAVVRSEVYLFVAILLMGAMAVSKDSAAAPYKLPSPIFWATKDVGTALYQTAATMADVLAPELGSKIRIIPGNDMEINVMMQQGRAHLACWGQDVFWSCTGLGVYAAPAFGPQPTRILWPGIPAGSGGTIIATKTSGIKTPVDLKGKKLANVTGSTQFLVMYAAALAYANLTLDDVQLIEYPSDGAKFRAFTQGKVDACSSALTAASSYEAEAGPFGLHVVAFPPDKEAWARLNRIVPFFFPHPSTEGAGIPKGGSVWTMKYPWPIIVSSGEMPDDFAYAIVKAIHKKMDKLVSAWSQLNALKPEIAIIPGVTGMAPFHSGAAKYFKEVGLWTPELEAANQKKLNEMGAWKARWEKFLEEAEAKAATKTKVNYREEWTNIMTREFGFILPKGF